MAQICEKILKTPGAEEAVRLGDVFAQLIEHYFYKGNIQAAFNHLESMQKKKIIVTPYLDGQLVEDIYKGMGMQMPKKSNQVQDDDIGEDIPEDF